MSKNPSINDIETFSIRGPWLTKSGGELDVLFALSHSQLENFFKYSKEELSVTNEEIRGLRGYRVSKLQKGLIGGNEWHRIKKELVIVTKGVVLWTFKDRAGKEYSVTLDTQNNTLLIPPYIFHTYKSLEDDSELLVITNTLFNPDNPFTHDTYPLDVF